MASPSHGRAAVAAIALTIGFYVLALGSSLGLLTLTYLQLTDGETSTGTGWWLIGGLTILWSILPRRDKFVAPGPRLEPEQQPELFAVLREVAQATGQAMPEEVYLIPEVNAYVLHRGGFLGYRSRRVMGIGLTMLQSVSVAELRAILAHEFGHYCNDDLRFAGWIYRTRAAIERTVKHLSSNIYLLSLPFQAYASLFIRVTQSIARAQELAADRLAAAVAGTKETISALVAVQRAGYCYQSYVDAELVPVLLHGFRPPIAAGFTAFMSAPKVASAIEEGLAADLAAEEEKTDDTHPPLRIRAANLGEPPVGAYGDAPRAISLLRELDRLEAELLEIVYFDPAAARELAPVQWEETGTRVFLPSWQKQASEHTDALRDKTARELAELVPAVTPLVAGSALAARLHDLGWMCDATPGKPIAFTRDGRTIEPFLVANRIHAGELSAPLWEEECRAAGIDRLPLI